MAFIDISTLDPAKTIVVSTGNAHKVVEIEEILGKVLPEVRFMWIQAAAYLGLACLVYRYQFRLAKKYADV